MARGLLNVALAAVAIALAFATPGEGAAKLRLASAGGSLSLSNSKDAQAVFRAAAMRPGEEASGSVTIGNTGSVPGTLTVAPAGVQDAPATGGGRLSDRLQLLVIDVTNVRAPATMYTGSLRAMASVKLGNLAPGASRTFLFVAQMTPGAGDNAFQGATLSAAFQWSATGSEVVVTPTPTPTPAPPVPRPATPAATSTPTPTAPPAGPLGSDQTGEALGARIFQMPAAKRCLSRRTFMIRVRLPKGMRFKTLTIRVNGKVKVNQKGLKARKVKARVNLRGMPKGKVVVKIVARTNTARKAVRKRTYHTCAKRR
jgi:spore coat-associated protein N